MKRKDKEIIETENTLKQKFDEIKLRDFSEVWEKLKDKVDLPTENTLAKKKSKLWIYLSAAAAACVILFCAVALPLLLRDPQYDIVYFDDDLFLEHVEGELFFESISDNVVDLSKYIGSGFIIKTTQEGVVKGGLVLLVDDPAACNITINLEYYDDDVQLTGKNKFEYDKTATVNGAVIKYKLTDSFPEYSIYSYAIEANFNSINYFITCTCSFEDPTQFFSEFFS